MTTPQNPFARCLFGGTILAAAVTAHAQPTLVFTRVAIDGDAVPEDPGAVLSDISGGPSVDNGVVVIEGSTTGGVDDTELIIVEPGQPIRPFVRQGQVAPGGFVYGSSSDEVLADGMVTWEDLTGDDTLVALPVGADPTLVDPVILAQVGQDIPAKPGTLIGSIEEFGYDDGVWIYELRDTSFDYGVYRFDGTTHSIIFDGDTPWPFSNGTGPVGRFGDVFIRNGQTCIVVQGPSSAEGGLLADFDDGAGLRPIVENGELTPGTAKVINGFGEAPIEGDYAAFQVSVTGGSDLLLYQNSTDTLSVIADETVLVPGETYTFTSFEGDPSLAGGYVMFEASGMGPTGDDGGIFLYSIEDQIITSIVRFGQMFDGQIVTGRDTRSPYGGSENQFGFQLRFEGGDEGVYVLSIIDECFADTDGNGTLNVDDVDAFVAGFLSGDLPVADCDGNLVLNVDDIDCFVDSFLSGCP